MALEVIAAGLGRTGTLSMKFALELLGFGRCHHMTEVFADAARQMPLWIEASKGRPHWEEIFRGFRSTSDYPSATFWRELADRYPDAKVVLTERNADDWFDSATATIFSPRMQGAPKGSIVQRFMSATVFDPVGADLSDRARVTRWFEERNAQVKAAIAPDRLLLFHPAEGWDRLCTFLGVPVPTGPFPRVNERGLRSDRTSPRDTAGIFPGEPELLEMPARLYIDTMRARAFGPAG